MTQIYRRVCITGMGMVSPLGNTLPTSWQNILDGRCGVSEIKQFDSSSWSTKIAAEVKNFKLHPDAICLEHQNYLTRPVEFGLQAAHEAMLQSGIKTSVEQSQMGVSIGAGIGTINPHELARLLQGLESIGQLRGIGKLTANSPESRMVMRNHPATLASLLSAKWQLGGPVNTIHTACASSGQSIGQAYWQIRRGDAIAMLAGGADSLAGELLMAGFCLLGALSQKNQTPESASSPFDRSRDGFVAGEGAAMVVLEDYEHAKNRGAKILAEVVGYGETESAYRITDLPPDGRGIVEAMQDALADAKMRADEVDYINAHGTSTQLNDRIEALAIERVFGESVQNGLCVSSTKSSTGHLISAAGALEFVFCVNAIVHSMIPPTLNLEQTDCSSKIDFVPKKARSKKVRAAMSNSIGFGGSNSSILVREVL